MMKFFAPFSLICGSILLAGCSGTGVSPLDQTKQNQHNANQIAAEGTLSEGIGLYDNGQFNAALKRLSAVGKYTEADTATQVTALKYMAFSYCVTSRPVLCKQQFQKAFSLNPAFNLAYGEAGHPLWGPVFDQARKEKK